MILFETRNASGQLEEYTVSEPTVLGNAGPVPLPPNAGKRVLEVAFDKDENVHVTDLGCASGVFVNGERIVRYGPLRADDIITIAGQPLRVKAVGIQRPAEPLKPTMHASVSPAPQQGGRRSSRCRSGLRPFPSPRLRRLCPLRCRAFRSVATPRVRTRWR